ncbi:hypothetical protein [Nonomuraea sp. NEAU-A123]|uniref:hypothetical protein n=1 Tax=Nonomuraea sp. NEAU-A123 TaxID=2839649 RepID=UPI001BE47176|nr:hypothetical protein [Nonomuraea sp. NEAU-A123]MBT2233652.1 hypothetical protein [Nonomuraea sp. NEAU-A123]
MESDRDPNQRPQQVALVLLCAAVFLDSMDLSLMGVALPAIGRDLSLPESTLQWLTSGYAVAFGLRLRRPMPVPTA